MRSVCVRGTSTNFCGQMLTFIESVEDTSICCCKMVMTVLDTLVSGAVSLSVVVQSVFAHG